MGFPLFGVKKEKSLHPTEPDATIWLSWIDFCEL